MHDQSEESPPGRSGRDLPPDGGTESPRPGGPRNDRPGVRRGERHYLASAALISLLVLILLTPGTLGTPSVRPGPSPPPPAASSANTPYIRHVVLIVLENEGLTSVWGHGPYERYLAGTYGNVTHFYAACHPSAPNYLAMIAAVTNECGSDTWHNDTNTTLGDLLDAAGDSWSNFAESLPGNACPHPGSATAGLFAVRHVPFLFFRDVLANQTFCRQHVESSSVFNASVANGTLPTFSLYTPNLCDDGHTGCGGNTSGAQLTAQADSWLAGFLAPILNHTGRDSSVAEQKLVKHTLFIVTWDEGQSNGGFAVANVTHYNNYQWCQVNGAKGLAVCGGPIYTAFISPYSRGTTFTQNVSDYSLSRTIEWLFHLPHLGNAGAFDARSAFPILRSMFNFTANRG